MVMPSMCSTDEDEFYAAKDWLLERFGAKAGADLAWVADQVLDYKWNYFDQDLTSWSPEEVATILLDRFPAKSSIDYAERPEVVTGFAAFLRWLGDEGLVPASHAQQLAVYAEALSGPFMEAMADESNWGMAKRFFSQISADGIDVSDEAGVQGWIEKFNAGSRDERDAILGPMPDAAGLGVPGLGVRPGERPAFPAVTLAPIEQLTAAADASIWLRRVRDFVVFVGEGRRLTDTGQLKLADGKELVGLLDTADRVDEKIGDRVFRTQSCAELREVDLTFRLAVAAGFAKVAKKRVTPCRKAKILTDSLEAWQELFTTVIIKLGLQQHRWSGSHYNFGWWAQDMDHAVPGMLTRMYVERGQVSVDELAAQFGDLMEETYVLDRPGATEMVRASTAHGLRDSFRKLEELGAVALTAQVPDEAVVDSGLGDPDDKSGIVGVMAELDRADRQAAWVELTPLGLWGMNRILSGLGDAPVVGALAGASATDLLNSAADLPADLATAEIDHWISLRLEEAPALLVEALINGGQATRGMALRALLRIGPPAMDAIDALAADGRAWPYAWVWRVDALACFEVDLPFDGDAAHDANVVAVLHAVLDVWGPVALDAWVKLAAGPVPPAEMLDRIWRVRGAETEAVLAAIGGASTDRAYSKAARKALFRYRSSAG